MMEARYIPHSKRAKYEADGWTVTPMLGHHGYYSLLAVRKLP